MGLFDKKFCDVCGEKIGLFGNRKLEDGNLCKNCASKLSPWFTGRRHSALADIKYQLEDRDANKARAAAFDSSQKLGNDGRALYLDDAKGVFAVCYESDWKNGNPDILPLSAVTNCRYETQEHRTERKQKDAKGNTVSYNPPVYDYSYDYYIIIDLNHPYIDEIRFRVNNMTLSRDGGSLLTGGDRKIIECEDLCKEIVEKLRDGGLRNASQGESTLVISEFTAPFHAKDPNGAYDMIVSLIIKGCVSIRVTNKNVYIDTMAADQIRYAINSIIMQLDQEGADVNSLDASLLDRRLMAFFSGAGLQEFGLEVKGTNIIPSIDPASKQMMERLVAVKQNLNTMNTAAVSASREWICPACSAKNESGKFCTFCGTPKP